MTSESTSSDPSGPFIIPELWAGCFSVRLARNDAEIDAVQALRYRVFYAEMGAVSDNLLESSQRDSDLFDNVADHLVVIDHSSGIENSVIATYRLLRSSAASKIGRFYSENEYDIKPILRYDGPILELGRSCVDPDYRNRGAMQLLWRGIAAYVFHYGIGVMFGCASLRGVDPNLLRLELSYLYHFHLAPCALRPRALAQRFVEMRRLEREHINEKAALNLLPPLIKGYLRLGGFVGDGAVIDNQFNTTDVAVVVKTDLVADKYFKHYERRSRQPEA